MHNSTESERNNQPTTPKEGAQIALDSVSEEVVQKFVTLDMLSDMILNDLPEDHPLRSQIQDLANIAKRGLEIVTKYRDAGFSGQFEFDIDSSGRPCLDIHPHSSTSISKQSALKNLPGNSD